MLGPSIMGIHINPSCKGSKTRVRAESVGKLKTGHQELACKFLEIKRLGIDSMKTLNCNWDETTGYLASCHPISFDADKSSKIIMDQWTAAVGLLNIETTRSCDPSICRMKNGFCVDCTKCSRHCTCNVQARPPNAMTVKQRLEGYYDSFRATSPVQSESDKKSKASF